MAKVRFNLHNPKEKETLVRLVFRYPGGKLVWYTGIKVNPKDWNTQTGRMRQTQTNRLSVATNERLRILAEKAEEIYLRYWNANQPLPLELFRQELTAFSEGRVLPVAGPVQLFDFIEQLIAERLASPDYSNQTLKSYRTCLKKLRQYEKEKRVRLNFESFDLEFHAKFTGWLSAQGFKPNYIQTIVKKLKTFLGVAVERGLTQKSVFRSRGFSVKAEEVERIYLNESELQQIAAVNLSDNPRLDRVRDLFLIGCYTGLRFSDFSALRAGNIRRVDGVDIITVTTQKTRKVVSVPVFPAVRAILDKRGGEPPKGYSNQPLNRYIKELCQSAGITAPVEVTRFVGGFKVGTSVEKYTLVSTHTARRSFATNEYLRALAENRSYRPIMDILGHSTEKMFFRYIKISGEQTAVSFAKARRAG